MTPIDDIRELTDDELDELDQVGTESFDYEDFDARR